MDILLQASFPRVHLPEPVYEADPGMLQWVLSDFIQKWKKKIHDI